MSLLNDLFVNLGRRAQPEDVARLIREGMRDRLTVVEKKILAKARRPAWWFSSMSQEFWKPAGMDRQACVATELFPAVATPSDTRRTDDMLQYVGRLGATVGARPDHFDFKQDRLNRAARRASGLGELSKRQYNKRFRLLARMEKKARKLDREWTKAELLQVAKSRLACRVTLADLNDDIDTAAFVAYLAATLNRRSVFTAGPQELAFDEIADMLLARVKRSTAAGWWAVAHVLPDVDVVARLTDAQKGRLLGLWHAALVTAADILKGVDAACAINRQTMVVRRVNDSSTWEAAAGAWNKVREGYVAVLHALGAEEVWDRQCLGKVPRLMAGDVTFWHRLRGDEICHPDVKVWAELPPQWEVLEGRADCTRQNVEAASRKHGVDPVKAGWTAPRPGDRKAAAFSPTPELVHGVAVTSPALAAALRKAGWFSGKGAKSLPEGTPGVEVVRDDKGFALSARPQVESPAETDKGYHPRSW
jgi:hypothetical protein